MFYWARTCDEKEVFMDHVLAELLSEVPDDIFFNDLGNPNFNAIFVGSLGTRVVRPICCGS